MPIPSRAPSTVPGDSRSPAEAAGHAVQVSDLYAMGWKAVLDAGDSLEARGQRTLRSFRNFLRAFENGWQSVDIAGEQDSCAGPIR